MLVCMENVFIDHKKNPGYVTDQKIRTETEKQILVDKFSDSNTVEHTGSANFA